MAVEDGRTAAAQSHKEAAQSGDTPTLSEREIEIVRLVATGATNQQIGRALFISPNTVKVHLRNVFEKLGVESRTEATMVAVRNGWVTIQDMPLPPAASVAQQPPAPTPIEAAPVSVAVAPLPPPQMPVLRSTLAPAQQRLLLLVSATLALLLGLMPTLAHWNAGAMLFGTNATPLSDRNLPLVNPASFVESPRWQRRATLPSARSRLAVGVVENKLYAMGGETLDGVSNETLVYDPVTNGWLPKATKPTAVSNVSAAVLEGKVYLPGGTSADEQVRDLVEVYDPISDSWSKAATLPAPRASYALAGMADALYVFGGWDGQKATRSAWRYDLAADRWSTLADLPAPLMLSAAATLPPDAQGNGRILLAGGSDGARTTDQVWIYNPAADTWSKRAVLGAPRSGLALVALNGVVYALGGQRDEAQPFTERYDLQTDTWSRFDAPFAATWRNMAAAALDYKIIAVGGWSGEYLPTTLELSTVSRQILPGISK